MGMLKHAAHELRIFTHRVVREYTLDNCMLRASSLAFSTLLALVPLSAFIFSLFTGFEAFEEAREQMQEALLDLLVPTMSNEVLVYIERFVENTRTLGVVGLLLFAFTSIILLNSITTNINAIWGSSSQRGFVRKFLMYLAVIVLSTLLIGASFTFTSTIRAVISGYPDLSTLLRGFFRLAPSLLVFITMWLLIHAVPSAKVNLKSSLIGAFAATLFWSIARFIFIDGTNYVIRLSLIYGSIAAIPIFLIWLSIIWSIIFLSSEITYVHQHRRFWWREQHGGQMPPGQQLLMGLQIYLFIARAFYEGENPPRIRTLAERFSISTDLVEFFTSRLASGGLVFKSPNSNPHILPKKELSRTSAGEVLEVLFGRQVADSDNTCFSRARDIVQQSIHIGRQQFDQLTVLQLIEEINQEAASV